MVLELLGWTGSLLVLTAYGLNSYQKIKSDSTLFYTINIAGGILLTVYAYYKDASANIFINLVWIAIALPGLVKVLTRKKT
ncbi:MAG TPA: hypothetical protein VD884_20790 [Ohtaekwangia sp.]|nr:hypothetical protein [Ohtaekwangia sp.]